jgi:hypothetical protein
MVLMASLMSPGFTAAMYPSLVVVAEVHNEGKIKSTRTLQSNCS